MPTRQAAQIPTLSNSGRFHWTVDTPYRAIDAGVFDEPKRLKLVQEAPLHIGFDGEPLPDIMVGLVDGVEVRVFRDPTSSGYASEAAYQPGDVIAPLAAPHKSVLVADLLPLRKTLTAAPP